MLKNNKILHRYAYSGILSCSNVFSLPMLTTAFNNNVFHYKCLQNLDFWQMGYNMLKIFDPGLNVSGK